MISKALINELVKEANFYGLFKEGHFLYTTQDVFLEKTGALCANDDSWLDSLSGIPFNLKLILKTLMALQIGHAILDKQKAASSKMVNTGKEKARPLYHRHVKLTA